MGSKTERLRAVYDIHGEKFRFLVVGAWNTLFSYVLFLVLLYALQPVLAPLASSDYAALAWVGEHYYLVVQWVSWVFAVPQSTTALKYLAFRSKGHLPTEIGRSFFVYLPMQAVSSFLLWLFSGLIGFPPAIGQLLTVGISAVLSYLGHKNFTFRQPAE